MAYNNINNEESFVADFQLMLRYLSRWQNEPSLSVAADGSFDDATRDAVIYYQQSRDIPVTGEIDNITWNKVYDEYTYREELNASPRSICPMPQTPSFTVHNGEFGQLVFLIQLMLNELLKHYDSYARISPNGRYETETVNAVAEFQRLNGITPTGEVDRRTWNRMAQQYDLTIENQFK